MTLTLDTLASIFITYYFFQAGINKTMSFNKTVSGFKDKVPFTKHIPFLPSVIIVGVILLEIFAPLHIIYSSFTKKQKQVAKASCYALIVFTILATLIYHPTSFAANLSVIGGLVLLSRNF